MELLLTATVDGENTVEGDLHLATGDFVWTSDLAVEVAQRLRVRLRFFKGEWFLDQREGTPWFQEVLVKGASDAAIRAIFSRVVRTCPGVAALNQLSFTVDAAIRELALDFTAKLEDGSTFRATQYGPFLVEF
jgi:hypothetical protein